MNWVNYLIQVNLYLVVFYAFYQLFLKEETFFNLNRTYLLGAAFFSIMIPMARAKWVKSLFITEQVQTSWANVNVRIMQGFASPIAEDNNWALGDYLTLIYLVVFTFLIIRLVYQLIKVKQLFKNENSAEAFSFFGKIKINPDLTNQKEIEKHELIHAKQLHSADVIFFEILAIINWFNPVCYLYKKAIKHIHEFIADEEAVKLSDKKEYAILLFSKNFGINPNQLTNNFFNQSLLKRRIKMLDKQKSKKAAILKYGLSAPLFLLAIILSSAKISENKTIDKIAHVVEPKKAIADIVVPKVVENLVNKPLKKEVKAIKKDDFSGLKKYLASTIKYPTEAKTKSIAGNIVIKFNIDNNGLIENPKAINWPQSALAKSALNVINNFKDKLNIKEDEYTISFLFLIEGTHEITYLNDDEVGTLKNFVGSVEIEAFTNDLIIPLNEVKKTDTIIDPKMVRPEMVFSKVDAVPSFPGGLQAFGKFLGGNLNYPKAAKDAKIEGRVYAQFVVEKDGSLTDIKIVRGIGYGCDEEALRVIAISPKWNPGVQNGEKVRVSYTVPIFFQIMDKKLPPPPPPIEIRFIKKSLFLIDGVEYNGSDRINKVKNGPGTVTVLKSEEAIKKYGDKAKDGAIEITTKKKD